MKLEYLYPELGNLYGDSANIRYLSRCLPDAELVETHLGEEPAFLQDADVSFLYSGPMTERGQRLALAQLEGYRDAVKARLDAGLHGLFTGNSMELLGKTIVSGELTLCGLGLVELDAAPAPSRYNGFFLGTCGDLTLTAFNSRFTHSHPAASVTDFAQVQRGCGLEPGCAFEGYRYHNLIGTYLLGPLLVLNPQLTKQLLRELGSDREPLFYQDAMAAYEVRLKEFSDKKRKLD